MIPPRGKLATARCAVLEARGLLRFRPSLSWAVEDSIVGFWRLPTAVRQDIGTRVPRFQVDTEPEISVRLDWEGFLATVECSDDARSGVGAVSVAWALALHAEVTFDEVMASLADHATAALATDRVVTHGRSIRRLLALVTPSQGDYYMAFLVLVTVLEKALYDLFHDRNKTANKKKNMILRDLLHSDALEATLPHGMMALLKILFLPSGLNLRNLVWHGFVVPAQFPRCFACLTAVLLLAVPRYFVTKASDREDLTDLFQLASFDDKFRLPLELRAKLATLSESDDLDTLTQRADGSAFVPPGREKLVHRALAAFKDRGDELWFLFGLLPVLEHAVRVQFVASNAARHGLRLDEFCVAQIDQYYSTLDGFGQRDKHQVLLHAEVAGQEDGAEPTLSALYHTMPSAALAVCLDLFMMAAGPNVRAKLCHGEADLSALLSRGDPRASIISQLVLLAWVTLCESYDHRKHPGSETKRPRLAEKPVVLDLFEGCVSSSFHPFLQLQRLLCACRSRLKTFTALRERWESVYCVDLELPEGDDSKNQLTKVEFSSPLDETGPTSVELMVIDKTARIREFESFLNRAEATREPVKKPKSFVEFLIALDAKAEAVQHRLSEHTRLNHSSSSPDLAEDPDSERYLLALSDADGLSVSACMMDILSSVDRSLASFEDRLTSLAKAIQDTTARTSQRRAFLNNVFFLPAFERIQTLTVDLVDHQVHHMETVARLRAPVACEEIKPVLCPLAIKFEQLQRKLLQFITAFEGCTGSAEGANKSSEKALQLALQFLKSKPLRAAVNG